MKALILGVRFVMELAALVALAYGGFHARGSLPARIALALALSLSATVIWGVFVAPKSPRRLREPLRLIPELLVFGGALAELLATGQGTWAIAFAIGAVIAVVGVRITGE